MKIKERERERERTENEMESGCLLAVLYEEPGTVMLSSVPSNLHTNPVSMHVIFHCLPDDSPLSP